MGNWTLHYTSPPNLGNIGGIPTNPLLPTKSRVFVRSDWIGWKRKEKNSASPFNRWLQCVMLANERFLEAEREERWKYSPTAVNIFFIPPPPPWKKHTQKKGDLFFHPNPIFQDQKCLKIFGREKLAFGGKKSPFFCVFFFQFGWGIKKTPSCIEYMWKLCRNQKSLLYNQNLLVKYHKALHVLLKLLISSLLL